MFHRIYPIFFILCCITAQMLQTKKPVLQLTSEQIKDTFDNVLSDDYIKKLAQDFASKAAEHFVIEMKNQKNALAEKFGQIYRSPTNVRQAENKEKNTVTASQNNPFQLKDLLDSHEALNLLKDPSPDGDHLDSQSGELSGTEAARDKIPVIEVMKINGAYYRRLLGLI